jgi:hypothetical protein
MYADHHDKMMRPPHEMAMGTVPLRPMPKKGRGAGALARQLVKVLFATALLAALVFVVMLTDQAETVSAEKGPLPSHLTLDVSTTITIVRAMQGVLAAVVAMILSQSFSYLQWGFLRSSKGGAPYVRQLALSPTTSVAGTLRLIFHRATGAGPRFWGFFRLLLLLLAGLGGIILFCTLFLISYPRIRPTH